MLASSKLEKRINSDEERRDVRNEKVDCDLPDPGARLVTRNLAASPLK